ncbi:MAG TPA: hypothetical protein VGG13_03585 [Candidatus Saccharimonadales bacterium]|jgi:hypothetical protein
MDNQKQSVIDRIKQANNILVTVSANPSVDQLAACAGLTLMLNELDKHATAVFSGNVPSTIEFLQPEKTLEKNTDSLRDFIIALDKSKADKLRYKVEDKVVKIFITPYRTSISQKDLEFSQGDFNVDVVVCLGVHEQKDLDQAITSHGRILHDATVIGINTTAGNNIGTLNWQNPQASSLSEMVASLADSFDKNLLDTQIATALLTGVVAETERFSNSKTSPETMKLSAQLMGAGANQQLVATKLAEPPPPPPELSHDKAPPSAGGQTEPPKNTDGTLRISHDHDEAGPPPEQPPGDNNEPPEEPKEEEPQIHIDERGQLHRLDTEEREFLSGRGPDEESVLPAPDTDEEQPSGSPPSPSKLALTPPTFDGKLTANTKEEDKVEELEPSIDPFSQSRSDQHQPILTHDNSSAAPPPKKIELPPAASDTSKTLTEIEESVDSPHVVPDPSSARSDALSALNNAPADSEFPKSRGDMGTKPLGGVLHPPTVAAPLQPDGVDSGKRQTAPAPPSPAPTESLGSLVEPLKNEPAPVADSSSTQPPDMSLPPTFVPSANTTPPTMPDNNAPQGPPPTMPPPIVPIIEPNGQ